MADGQRLGKMRHLKKNGAEVPREFFQESLGFRNLVASFLGRVVKEDQHYIQNPYLNVVHSTVSCFGFVRLVHAHLKSMGITILRCMSLQQKHFNPKNQFIQYAQVIHPLLPSRLSTPVHPLLQFHIQCLAATNMDSLPDTLLMAEILHLLSRGW